MEAELPEGWDARRLGDVVQLRYGKSLTKSKRMAGPVPVVGSAGVVDWHNEALVHEPTIVVGRKGSLGTVYRFDEPSFPIDTVFYTEPNEPANLIWLENLLVYSNLAALNEATGVPGLNRDRAHSLPVRVPPLPEQQRIAEILTAAEDSIRAGERVIEQAERVKKGLMEELLTGGLGSAAIERGEVPEGWSGGTAGRLAEPKGLQTGPFGSQLKSEDYDADGTVHVVMPKDISGGTITYDTTANISVGRAEPLLKHRLRYGDILFARRGDLSKIAVYLGGPQAICGTGCLRLRPQMDQFDALFLSYLFSMPHAARWLEANAVGVTMLNLNTKIIAELPVAYPTEIEQQQRIASILIGIDDQISAERKHVEQLKRLKQGLMDDLLTGRVRTV